ncbi:SDR family NAD(P)-dependent oxidoreductase [Actinacidiphila guanduensis]|uniref:NADP-dependent 3-hydroxy acid dehydrogenase YdfG n=1 Tax=Actinacidiphila guanduensis TaxID=310781 RepID=A0A1H0PYU7_9ACTN|nr:SDR family NAD(P)-dependent oxidoreductase [Actinacidiphila guanduensis]SDP10312.1 NADP-dependent 3-hydroxy acid dehydrogenase YdfG [Actinacidiphila guanduensis]
MTRTFLVTGAAGGLGGSVVAAALAAGFNVLATDLDPEGVTAPSAHRGRLRTRALDVTDPAAARDAVACAVAEFGAVDVLVNSAGIRDVGSIEDMTEEAFRRNVEVNFFGVVNTVRAVLPVMRERRSGSIVNVSTIGGRRNQPGLGAYQSSKWAVGGFTEILAREVAPLGIRVTLAEPGGIRTPWATAPIAVPDLRPEYEGTVGAFVRSYRDNPDVMRGDPSRMAEVILRITSEPAPPVRLLLGSDAVWLASRLSEARAAEDAAWRETSLSTDFDGLGDFADTEVARLVGPSTS